MRWWLIPALDHPQQLPELSARFFLVDSIIEWCSAALSKLLGSAAGIHPGHLMWHIHTAWCRNPGSDGVASLMSSIRTGSLCFGSALFPDLVMSLYDVPQLQASPLNLASKTKTLTAMTSSLSLFLRLKKQPCIFLYGNKIIIMSLLLFSCILQAL